MTTQYVHNGIEMIRQGSYHEARQDLGQAMRFDPQNADLHFLNALSYHLEAEQLDPDQFAYAQIGYDLSLKYDPNHWLAAQQLARLHLSRREYRKAQEYFAAALLHRPEDASLYYGLAQASYYLGDMDISLGAVQRASELDPGAPEIMSGYALISSASGKDEVAQREFEKFSALSPGSSYLVKLEERMRDWKMIRSRIALAEREDLQPTRTMVEPPDSVDDPPRPRMVMVDITMIRTEENESTNKGLNLLENLWLTFGGNFDGTPADGNIWTVPTKRFVGSLSVPEVSYGLGMFNVGEDRTEVLALPTLIALDGVQSSSFAGATLNVAVKGVQAAQISSLDAGITLTILPTFLSDNVLQLHVEAKRTFVEDGAVGSFEEAVRTSHNEVTADVVLDIGETLVLSGLREKETTSERSGVPLLGDIPIIQYLFSKESTTDYHKSSIILITPRHLAPGMYRSARTDESAPLGNNKVKEFRSRYPHLFSKDDNIIHIMRHLHARNIYAGLGSNDLFDRKWWGDTESIGTILRRAASFLYY